MTSTRDDPVRRPFARPRQPGTAGPYVDHVFPLGAKRGGKTRVQLSGQGVPQEAVEIEVPKDAPRPFVYRYGTGPTRSSVTAQV